MSVFPWLTVAGAIPLAGSVAVALIPGQSVPGSPADARARDLIVKWVALGCTLAMLAVTLTMGVAFRPGGPDFQFTQVYRWIPQFGVYYALLVHPTMTGKLIVTLAGAATASRLLACCRRCQTWLPGPSSGSTRAHACTTTTPAGSAGSCWPTLGSHTRC